MDDLSERLREEETKYTPRERRVFGIRLDDLPYNIIDHNSIVAIWEDDPQDTHYANRLWKGVAHSIPPHLLERKFKRIFSSIPETILEGEPINIEVYWEK